MGNWVYKGAVLFLVAAAFSSLAHAQSRAQVYSWTDASGVRHYGDSNSAPLRAKKIAVRATPAPSADRPSSTPAPETTSNSAPDPAAQNEAQACRVARNNRKLLADPKQNVLSEDGKSVLDENSRAQRLALADKRVEAYCQVLGTDEEDSK